MIEENIKRLTKYLGKEEAGKIYEAIKAESSDSQYIIDKLSGVIEEVINATICARNGFPVNENQASYYRAHVKSQGFQIKTEGTGVSTEGAWFIYDFYNGSVTEGIISKQEYDKRKQKSP